MDPGRLMPGQNASVAFVSYHAPTSEVDALPVSKVGSIDIMGPLLPTRRALVRGGFIQLRNDADWTGGGTDYGGCLGRIT